MIEDIRFMGRAIGEEERKLLSKCFDEKIDDLKLCHAILAIVAQPGYELERGAFTRGLKHGYCSYGEGKRPAKKLIRRVRWRLGYRGPLLKQVAKAQEFLRWLQSRRKKKQKAF